MPYIFYDTETTGLSDAFDQILQFAALHADDDLRVMGEIELRCRIQPGVVPSPGALLTTRVAPADLHAPNRSHLEMVREVVRWLAPRLPATFVGHNSVGFDEGFLRQAFYKTLHPVYLTSTGGNARGDTMLVAQAAHLLEPGALAVPAGPKGLPSFKLGPLARANGIDFEEDAAHDALADVHATLDLARVLRMRAPEAWRRMAANGTKAGAAAVADAPGPLVHVEWYGGRQHPWLAAPCGAMPGNAGTRAVFDLSHDPAPYLGMPPDALLAAMKGKGPKPFRLLRLSNQPQLFPASAAPGVVAGIGVPPELAASRAATVRGDARFRGRVEEALAGYYGPRDAEHVEQRIHDGFPGRDDERLRGRFHRIPWEERLELCSLFADARLAEIGRRLVHAERPDLLPPALRAEIDAEYALRALSDDPKAPWTTIAKARSEIEKRRGDADGDALARLADIAAHIDALEAGFEALLPVSA